MFAEREDTRDWSLLCCVLLQLLLDFCFVFLVGWGDVRGGFGSQVSEEGLSEVSRGVPCRQVMDCSPARWRPQKKTMSSSLLSADGYSFRGKKRKQASRDADSLSLCTLDINEPSAKRSKALVSRVTSLAGLLPIKTAPLKRFGLTLQRSISFRKERGLPPPSPPTPPPGAPAPSSSSSMKMRVTSAAMSNSSSSTSSSCSSSSGSTTSRVAAATGPVAKRRDSKLWSETFDVHLGAAQTLSPKDIKRQEAIFELAQGEQDLVEDLKLAKKAYHDPMLKLSIMTEQELNQIFGTLDSLIPLHEDLLSRLCEARKPDGSTEHVGQILTGWLPCLSSYTAYCSNQVWAKALLDQKKLDRRVQDFLQRCQQSPFSRKLDLWNFLDIPRSRLVKYPLLLREILKHTPEHHPDRPHLDQGMLLVQGVVADINRRTGESECQFYKDRLLYAEVGHRDALIQRSRTLSCHGELKNNRGLKLHVFLFQDVLVITRSVSLNEQPVSYQLCRQPIPICQLDLEDVSDGEMRVGGSIRGAFSNNERTKNFFRVSYRVSGGAPQSHCFQASDAFNKQQWINCIRQAKEAAEAEAAQENGPCFPKDVRKELEAELETELEPKAVMESEPEPEDDKRLCEQGENRTASKVDTGSDAAVAMETEQAELRMEMVGDVGETRNGDAEEEMEEAFNKDASDEENIRC